MRTLVIYKSKYGTTKKYGNWIREELKADMLDLKRINKDILRKYDNIIYGAGIYGERMSGLKDFMKFYDAIQDKNIFVFTVGLTNPFNRKNIDLMDNVVKKDVNDEAYKNMKVYHYLGAIDYKKLSFFNKIMMKMFTKISKKNKDLTEEDRSLLDSYTRTTDLTRKEFVTELVQNVKKK